MDEKIRFDRVRRACKSGEIQIPMGHYALIALSKAEVNNGTKIAIYGLGSCIALILYDRVKKIGAMSHILLPEPRGRRANLLNLPHKYASSSVQDLLGEMLKEGASKKNLRAVIIGGADIFQDHSLEMGKENTLAVKHQLELLKIKLEKEIVGGHRGRVLIYDITDNSISVKITGEDNFRKVELK